MCYVYSTRALTHMLAATTIVNRTDGCIDGLTAQVINCRHCAIETKTDRRTHITLIGWTKYNCLIPKMVNNIISRDMTFSVRFTLISC